MDMGMDMECERRTKREREIDEAYRKRESSKDTVGPWIRAFCVFNGFFKGSKWSIDTLDVHSVLRVVCWCTHEHD